jgi:iron donor protein CyaY
MAHKISTVRGSGWVNQFGRYDPRRFYNVFMLEEIDFRRKADAAVENLKKSLIAAEDDAAIEVEEQNGVLNVVFEEPPAKFVITPNAPVRQIWISALSTSFKLDWSDIKKDFVLEKTGEGLKQLVARLVNQQLGEEAVSL